MLVDHRPAVDVDDVVVYRVILLSSFSSALAVVLGDGSGDGEYVRTLRCNTSDFDDVCTNFLKVSDFSSLSLYYDFFA